MIFTKTVYNSQPDYSRPLYELKREDRDRIKKRLAAIYGHERAREYMPELERILKIHQAHKPERMLDSGSGYDPENRFTEKDVILITYGDLIQGDERSPLATLARFCDAFLKGAINTLHILPFFPYSSDRGFAVTDFSAVDPKLGTWEDIEELEERYQLMFDGVINHVSSKSRWFQEFLNGSPYYGDFFFVFESPEKLSEEDRKKIFRPRTSDILVKFDTIEGPRYVWATFSRDQIDLNFKNPDVLIRVLDVLLLYVRHGADIIRLDAVTYLWDEPGTRCIHLEETHEIIRLFRDILDTVAPGVAIITETNVPHEENISYFGNGSDEAHIVYNFALPPLVLFSFYRGDASALSRWAGSLQTPSRTTTFFNFLDSHDGIGLMGVKNILSKDEIEFIIKKAEDHGGLISYKTGESGAPEPYEINITWYSAMNKDNSGEDTAVQVKRFTASRAAALVLKGVPGIYLHSLLGTENDIQAVLQSNVRRDINRTVVNAEAVFSSLAEPSSKISLINNELGKIIALRIGKRAFHPNGDQNILDLSPEIFSVLRTSPEGDQHIISLINVSSKTVSAFVIPADCGLTECSGRKTAWVDIISGKQWSIGEDGLNITMEPYDVLWLEPYNELEQGTGG